MGIVIVIFAFTNISNNTISIFLMKIILLVLFFFIIYLTKKNEQVTIKNFSFIIYYFILIFLSGATLLYSTNLHYGVSKFVNLIINVPILFSFKFFYDSFNKTKSDIIIYSAIIVSHILFFIFLFFNPFDQITAYKFSLLRWSHVTFSRVFSFIFLYLLFVFMYSKNKKLSYLLSIALSLIFYELYFASLRAAIIGLIIFLVIFCFYYIKYKILSKEKIILLLTSFLISFLLIITFSNNKVVENRYQEIANLTHNEIKTNSGINARLIAYKKSVEIIKKNWLLGIGLGAFKGYNNDEFLDWIRYPHNIFLEFQIELGLMGTIFFLFYLIKTFNVLKEIDFFVLLTWLYALWLAMFAKDISSNLIVFIPLIFYGNPYSIDKLKEFFIPNKNSGVLSGNSSEISE